VAGGRSTTQTPEPDAIGAADYTGQGAIATDTFCPYILRMKITVSELARRVAVGASRKEAAIVLRRLRHWTQIGVLPGGDDAEIHTGSGRHREYSFEDIRFAALALELAKWKMPVGPLKWILNELHTLVLGEGRDAEFAARWQAAIDGSTADFNPFSPAFSSAPNVFLVVRAPGDDMDAHFDFDISLREGDERLVARGFPGTDHYDNPRSALFVDLTELFRRLAT
jgi:hypothetical protein